MNRTLDWYTPARGASVGAAWNTMICTVPDAWVLSKPAITSTKTAASAFPVILGEIKKLFRDGGTVKVSRSLKELGMRVQAAREHHMKLCGTEPTLSQLAEELDEPVENITLAIQAAQPAMSLTPENTEDGDRQLDIPVDSPEEALAERISLEEVLRALPEQDQQLIRLRFYGNKTQSETAKVLHTTQVQISRRERRILSLLRHRLLED